jgi:hypothetical protein
LNGDERHRGSRGSSPSRVASSAHHVRKGL